MGSTRICDLPHQLFPFSGTKIAATGNRI